MGCQEGGGGEENFDKKNSLKAWVAKKGEGEGGRGKF